MDPRVNYSRTELHSNRELYNIAIDYKYKYLYSMIYRSTQECSGVPNYRAVLTGCRIPLMTFFFNWQTAFN